jgi:hypothetical protein
LEDDEMKKQWIVLGKQVLDQAKLMVGRLPLHRGCSREGIYLKWLVEDTDDGATNNLRWRGGIATRAVYRAPLADLSALKVLHDWLLDQDIDVAWTDMEKREYSEEQNTARLDYLDQHRHIYQGDPEERQLLVDLWKRNNPPAGRFRRWVKLDLR